MLDRSDVSLEPLHIKQPQNIALNSNWYDDVDGVDDVCLRIYFTDAHAIQGHIYKNI